MGQTNHYWRATTSLRGSSTAGFCHD